MRLRIAGVRAAKTGVAWCALGRLAGAQVAGIGVDPHLVVLSAARPAGEITVLNPRATRAEFSVDLRFGFATTDSSGNLRVELSDGPDSASAADWVAPYPRTFTLRGGTTRTVRFLARPPADLVDGEYWARITIHSRDEAPLAIRDTASTASTASTAATIAMETATVIPLFYRNGIVSTGITIGAVEATRHGDSVHVRAPVVRTGNGAFIGVARISVRGADGREIATAERQLAVYRSMRPHWTIALPHDTSTAGCSVVIRFATDRRDVPAGALLHAAAIESAPVYIYDAPP